MKFSHFLFAALLSASAAQAQDVVLIADKEAAYTKTITTRAQKIVTTLGIDKAAKAETVTQIIAGQYRSLNEEYTKRDALIKLAKENLASQKELLAAKTKTIEVETATAVAKLQQNYIRQLRTELSEEQVTKVKDGMTYGVLPLTYAGYMDMLPNLTAEQKAQIMTWLLEAREFAMSAESSDKKHWWFGKYKGRINNYLSAAGYDLKKESEAWHKRLAERKEQKTK